MIHYASFVLNDFSLGSGVVLGQILHPMRGCASHVNGPDWTCGEPTDPDKDTVAPPGHLPFTSDFSGLTQAAARPQKLPEELFAFYQLDMVVGEPRVEAAHWPYLVRFVDYNYRRPLLILGA